MVIKLKKKNRQGDTTICTLGSDIVVNSCKNREQIEVSET